METSERFAGGVKTLLEVLRKNQPSSELGKEED